MNSQDLLAQLEKLERQALIRLHKQHIHQLDKYGPTNYLVQMVYQKLIGTDSPQETLSSWLKELEENFLSMSQTSWLSLKNPHVINFIWLMIINKRAAELFINFEKGQHLSTPFIRYIDNQADLSPKFKTMTLMRFPINWSQWRSRNEKTLHRRTNHQSYQTA